MSTLTALDWRARAACAKADPDLFFPEPGTPAEQIAEAKQYCAACPVRQTCLEDAMRRSEPDAICGGLTVEERQALLHPRGVTKDGKPRVRRPGKTSARQLAVTHGAYLLSALVEWRMSVQQAAVALGSTPRSVYRAYVILVPPRPGRRRSTKPSVLEELLRTSKEQLLTLERRGLSHAEIGVVLKVDQSYVSAALSVLRQREEGIRRLSRDGREGLQRLWDEETRILLESGVGLSPRDVVEAFGQTIRRMHCEEGVPLRHVASELGLCRETVRQAYQLMVSEQQFVKKLKQDEMEEAA